MQGGDQDQQRQLLSLNGLDYRLAPSLSVAVSRSHRSFPATRQEFGPGNKLSFVFGSGAAYVDCRASYITFDLEVDYKINTAIANGDADLSFSFGSNLTKEPGSTVFYDKYGSSTNLFLNQKFTHASGTEIDRIDEFNSWSRHVRQWTRSDDWHRTVGAAQGLPLVKLNVTGLSGAQSVSYDGMVLPLNELGDVFNQEALMPSFLAAGAQLELELDTPYRVFTLLDWKTGGDAPVVKLQADAATNIIITGYTVKNPRLVLSTIVLTDSIQRALSNVSASSGLEYPFESVFFQGASGQHQRTSIQITRAISRANKLWAFVTNTARTDNTIAATAYDTFTGSLEPGTEYYQVQLGAEFIPTSPVGGVGTAGLMPRFMHALEAFGHLHNPRAGCAVDPAQMKVLYNVAGSSAGVGDVTAHNGRGSLEIIAIPLERSTTLSQSGSAISSQRTCNLNISFKLDDATRRIYCYVHYVKLVTSFLDSCIVRS